MLVWGTTPITCLARVGCSTTSMPATDAEPAGGDHPRGEHAGGRRLAGAVGAEQTEDLALVDGEVERVDRLDVARVHLGQRLGADHLVSAVIAVRLLSRVEQGRAVGAAIGRAYARTCVSSSAVRRRSSAPGGCARDTSTGGRGAAPPRSVRRTRCTPPIDVVAGAGDDPVAFQAVDVAGHRRRLDAEAAGQLALGEIGRRGEDAGDDRRPSGSSRPRPSAGRRRPARPLPSSPAGDPRSQGVAPHRDHTPTNH